ncbi:flippase-like domain-containing protein [Halorubrum trueperi]|uniref:Flippase-like domain-containing protein n=1 Tax=Halorubrum trueperi TaxID=2004704 RepID=A0ABD5ULL8_9EURY
MTESLHVELVVPAYNENGNLERMVERTMDILRNQATDWTFNILLVVSDGSTDGTQAIAEELDNHYPEVSRLVRTDNFGFGNALKDGLSHVEGDILIPFMADLSDDPADIPQMIEQIRDGYDVVYGSRFITGGSVEGYPPLKLAYNRAFNNLIRFMFGIGEKDITNAFTAYRREVIDEIETETLNAESFDITAELPLRATIKGFRTTEVPVSWRSRDAGVSKLNATKKGPDYIKRVFAEFARGNLAGLRDLFAVVTNQGPVRMFGAAVFGVLLLVGLFSLTGYSEVFDTLQQVNLLFIIGIAIVYPISFVFRTWRWRVLLRASEHLASRGNAFRCIMAGWFLNSLIPARAGDVLRGYSLKTTDGVPFSVGIGTIVIERVFDMLVLGMMILVVAVFFVPSNSMVYLAGASFSIGVILLIGLLMVYFVGHRVTEVSGDRFMGLSNSIQTVQRALRRVSNNPFALALSGFLSVPVWLAEVATIYFAARAVGVELGVIPTVSAGVAAFVSQAVPITPGGLGTYETAITSVLVLFEVESSTGFAIGLVDHFTRLAVIYIIGTISVIHIVFQSRPYFNNSQSSTDDSEAENMTNISQGSEEEIETG